MKKYVYLTQNSLGDTGKLMAEKYKVGGYSFLILSPDGEEIVKYTNHPSGDKVSSAIEGTADFRSGMEALAKAKDKGKPSENASAIGNALKMIGKLESKKSEETIMEYVKDESLPTELRATAIGAMSKQSDAAKSLLPFLTDSKFQLKSSATNALKAMGTEALPALFDALESDNVDLRAAAFQIASQATKNAKLSKEVGFWKTGKSEAREKALSEWKSWYESTQAPKPETKK